VKLEGKFEGKSKRLDLGPTSDKIYYVNFAIKAPFGVCGLSQGIRLTRSTLRVYGGINLVPDLARCCHAHKAVLDLGETIVRGTQGGPSSL